MNNYGACDAELDGEVSKKSSKEDLQKLMKISPTHNKMADLESENFGEESNDSVMNRRV